MSNIRKLKLKIYYIWANLVINKNTIKLTQKLKQRRNIFIYFDYERQFGGNVTQISDADISEILKILENYNIKSTWFTVGRVLEEYPESVKEIIIHEHEIGSHTHSHIVPLYVSSAELKDDFSNFSVASLGFDTEIAGFHSPNSKWSINLLKYLRDYKFSYDLIHCKKNDRCNTLLMKRKNKNRIIRLQTVGDDWLVYKQKLNENDVFNYFKGFLNRIRNGEIAGIGFHPWILSSDQKIMDGFRYFIKYIGSSQDFYIKPAKYFVDDVKEIINNQ